MKGKVNTVKILMITIVAMVLLSSCGSTQNTCAAYANVDCENCDEID